MHRTRTGNAARAAGNAPDRQRRVRKWLWDAAHVAIGPAEPTSQRQDVVRRALLAPLVIGVMPIQQLHFPGWQVVVLACITALIYDIPIAYVVFVKKQMFLGRVLSFVLDGALLSGASLFVLRELGAAGSSSDLWLAFLVFVVSGGFALAPVGSLIYTGLAMGWFAAGTVLFFPEGSQFREQLPVRMVFFATLGLIALAMALELEKRRSRLQQQNRQTLGMLAKLVEARDTDAGAHLHRIQYFSRALALHLGLSERETQEVAYASMIHDVGKAHVPDAVLQKAGPLTADEWRTMQRHTVWGDRLLADNSDFEIARQVARWHHEHWDGGGYPDGLSGEQIPLAARIAAVADVYDALISERPYKDAWPPSAAIRELQRLAGSHLDPQIVRVFVELWRSGVIDRISAETGAEGLGEEAFVRQAA